MLVTSVLGASANWLIVRFLCDALSHGNIEDGDGQEDTVVVFVSWLRDWEFWKQEARKGGGLDLERLRAGRRVAFVDGLGAMFLGEGEGEKVGAVKKGDTGTMGGGTRAGLRGGIVPVRTQQHSIVPTRGPPGRIPAPAPTATGAAPSPSPAQSLGHFTLKSPDLSILQSTIESAITHLQTTAERKKKILLVLDSPDALLALASSPSLTPSSLCTTLLTLHTNSTQPASHILIHLHADTPLLSLSSPPQPLEIAGHNLLVKIAHMSSRICSCRVLDTGVARDVSGVITVTCGRDGGRGLGVLDEGKDENEDEERRGRELLYFVKGDGGVRVFERGAGEGL
ncbi:hypothetical protein BCR34DRAFT_601299 [Clohesyomyces aquaticus]|uniref:Elongator complex protein 5 n=1 Tax=Clohesyomyces aquaticus TaxID=1231657 RepID=A0A1Y1ZMS0_9PLEO|nr:hypothetical protein BCR34DRAFT_601299 [Clohesyomyces aquaticus]